jgi:adenine-specific DNA-methyltransferase
MTELIWEGKYKDGKKQGPMRIALPFQTIETVNESAQDRQRTLELFAQGRPTEWRNRLIWGDKKYVLPSLLPEFAGKVNLIYIDPPFVTGADFSFTHTIPNHRNPDEDPAHNQWQSYRTRQDPKISLNVNYLYPEAGNYTIVVKVIGILGNDTTKTLEVEAK